jgi:hypothetical protein
VARSRGIGGGGRDEYNRGRLAAGHAKVAELVDALDLGSSG